MLRLKADCVGRLATMATIVVGALALATGEFSAALADERNECDSDVLQFELEEQGFSSRQEYLHQCQNSGRPIVLGFSWSPFEPGEFESGEKITFVPRGARQFEFPHMYDVCLSRLQFESACSRFPKDGSPELTSCPMPAAGEITDGEMADLLTQELFNVRPMCSDLAHFGISQPIRFENGDISSLNLGDDRYWLGVNGFEVSSVSGEWLDFDNVLSHGDFSLESAEFIGTRMNDVVVIGNVKISGIIPAESEHSNFLSVKNVWIFGDLDITSSIMSSIKLSNVFVAGNLKVSNNAYRTATIFNLHVVGSMSWSENQVLQDRFKDDNVFILAEQVRIDGGAVVEKNLGSEHTDYEFEETILKASESSK